MQVEYIAVLGIATIGFAVFGRAVGRAVPSPLYFALVGMVAYALGAGSNIGFDTMASDVIVIALAVVLFSDAARLRIPAGDDRWAEYGARLLLLVMPLTVIGVALLALALPLGVDVATAILLAGVLAPTDAALADPVVHDQRIPERYRDSLLVEAGLNDGLATPIIAAAAAAASIDSAIESGDTLLGAIVAVIAAGVIGSALGAASGWALRASEERGWASTSWVAPALVGVAAVCYVGAEHVGAIGLVSVFVGGAAFREVAPRLADASSDFAEGTGRLLASGVFLWFGFVAASSIAGGIDATLLVLAVLLVVVVRPLSVFIGFWGQHVDWRGGLLLGWYGPRGLATVLFAALLSTGGELPVVVRDAAIVVVSTSLLLHGLTSGLAPRLAGRAKA